MPSDSVIVESKLLNFNINKISADWISVTDNNFTTNYVFTYFEENYCSECYGGRIISILLGSNHENY